MESNKHFLDIAEAHVQALHSAMCEAGYAWNRLDSSDPDHDLVFGKYMEARISYYAADSLYQKLLAAEDERLATARA